MNLHECIERLANGGDAIRSLAVGVSDEQARWRPAQGEWSVLEVINHLYDEERDDFRMRLDLLLHHPEKTWPDVDPETWCTERRYNEADMGESLGRFSAERELSIAWLGGLATIDWEKSYRHPKIGALRAGDLMASWVAHDCLHLRQLTRLHYEYHRRAVEPYSTSYAGDW